MPNEVIHPSALLNWVSVDRAIDVPLFRQISDQLRSAIMSGDLASGAYLPASRSLAVELRVSRNTTLKAYDKLLAEGFLESRQGSGTRVARVLDERPTATRNETQALFRIVPEHTEVHIQEMYEGEPPGVTFQPGIPGFDAFPRLLWSRLLRRHALRNDQFILDYAHIGGYAPLRLELAKYLNGSRGVACSPEQVIVVTSTRAAIVAVARTLWKPGATVAVEDPGYTVAMRVLSAAGIRLRLVPVDERGVRVQDFVTNENACAGVYLTPAHQWPMGVTLSAERRMDLLDWAERAGAWILEDDYDSEFRFDSPPVAPLHASGTGRVIYIGTFSKTLVPSIRTAYLVVPTDLVHRFERTVYQHGVEPALHVQAALADLISDGHFARHIVLMRKLYKKRRAILVDALHEVFQDRLDLTCPAGGLQIIAHLPDSVPALRFAQEAAEADLVARPMAAYQVHGKAPNAVHLGFAAVPEADIESGVRRLHEAVSSCF